MKSAEQEGASDAAVLIAAAHRIDNLIHYRRTLLLARASAAPANPGSA
jgi:hypothetical protein